MALSHRHTLHKKKHHHIGEIYFESQKISKIPARPIKIPRKKVSLSLYRFLFLTPFIALSLSVSLTPSIALSFSLFFHRFLSLTPSIALSLTPSIAFFLFLLLWLSLSHLLSLSLSLTIFFYISLTLPFSPFISLQNIFSFYSLSLSLNISFSTSQFISLP